MKQISWLTGHQSWFAFPGVGFDLSVATSCRVAGQEPRTASFRSQWRDRAGFAPASLRHRSPATLSRTGCQRRDRSAPRAEQGLVVHYETTIVPNSCRRGPALLVQGWPPARSQQCVAACGTKGAALRLSDHPYRADSTAGQDDRRHLGAATATLPSAFDGIVAGQEFLHIALRLSSSSKVAARRQARARASVSRSSARASSSGAASATSRPGWPESFAAHPGGSRTCCGRGGCLARWRRLWLGRPIAPERRIALRLGLGLRTLRWTCFNGGTCFSSGALLPRTGGSRGLDRALFRRTLLRCRNGLARNERNGD